MDVRTLERFAAASRRLDALGGIATGVAMAHSKARKARARATTTCWACLPLAIRWRERVQSRTWAFQLIAGIAVGSVARRSGRGRLTVAGYRDAQAPSTKARRAWGWPVLV